jgi:REP element-mobilizing transposase RayT
MNRGNRKCPIFEDDRDRRRYVWILKETCDEYQVEFLSGSLLGNHFHHVVTTPEANISEFMEQLQGRFAQYSNWRHKRVGHLFQGRFRAVVIEDDIHLLTALCYVFMNPVAAGLVSRMEDWKWSSYAATVGLAPSPDYLRLDWLDALFPGTSRQHAQQLLKVLLSEARPVVAYLRSAETVGREPIQHVIRSYTGEKLYRGPVPREYRQALRPALDTLFVPGAELEERNSVIYCSHMQYGYTFAEIAQHIDLCPESIGRICRALRKRIGDRDAACGA